MGTLGKDLHMGKRREALTVVGIWGWEGDWLGKAGPGLCWVVLLRLPVLLGAEWLVSCSYLAGVDAAH